MRLEEEIKQKSFSSIYQRLNVNIIYTGNWLTFLNTEQLRKYGLTLPQYNILRILRGQHPKPASINLLIERMLDKSSNASRIIDRLVAKKLVKKTICKKDKRAVDVIILNTGLNLLKEIDKEKTEWEKPLMSISNSEANELNYLLDKLRNNRKLKQ